MIDLTVLLATAKARGISVSHAYENDRIIALVGHCSTHGVGCQAALVGKKRGTKVHSGRAFAMQVDCYLRARGLDLANCERLYLP